MTSSSEHRHRLLRKPRLLFLVTEYSYFVSHKLLLASAAHAAGFDVTVAARFTDGEEPEVPDGHTFNLVPLSWRRSGSIIGAALKLIPDMLRVRRVLADVQPDVVHCISLKPAIIGALAAYRSPMRVIHSINGFGFIFYDRSILARAVQVCCGAVLRRSVAANDGRIVVQNSDDLKLVVNDFRVLRQKLTLIRGSGIDLLDFKESAEPPQPPIVFVMLTRLLYMKGLHIAIAAFKIIQDQGLAANLVVCGAPDPGNPSSIPQHVVDEWSQIPGVSFRGHLDDVKSQLAASHCMIHPALGGEGLPRALLEAAAIGRPMIASDVAGNREIVCHEQTGLLVSPGDPEALAAAMSRMLKEAENRQSWGGEARRRAETEFSSEIVRQSHEDLYRMLCDQ